MRSLARACPCRPHALFVVIWAVLVQPLPATEPTDVELETTKVTGHRELPRVMAIVPWKKAPPGELPGRPLQSLLDETLVPVDRRVLRREAENWASVNAAAPAANEQTDSKAGKPTPEED
ncbi:MAG: hypothetical protein P8080_04695 [Gammaproteobacteria bacterium]